MSFHFVRVKRVRLRDEELQALPCTWHTSIRICIGVEVELISLPWVRSSILLNCVHDLHG